jgi:hypothetical protein
MSLRILTVGWLVCAVTASCASEPPPKPPLTWDGLALVPREGLDRVYIRPCASLASYKRVMLRHAEVSFDQNWMPFTDPGLRSRNVDPNRIARDIEALFSRVMTRELQQHSYEIVSYPDDDVLRVVPAITDLFVKFADPAGSADGSSAFLLNTGHLTLVAELRDSVTNTLLARVVDRMDEHGADIPVGTSATGAAAAERMVTTWAVALRTALDRAHAPPVEGKGANSKTAAEGDCKERASE